MNNIYNSLTDSAKYSLKNILQEYEKSLLEEAYIHSACSKNDKVKISLKDILSAKEKLQDATSVISYSQNRRKKFWTLMTLVGLVYAIMGLVIFVVQHPVCGDVELGLLLVIMGINLSLFAIINDNVYARQYAIRSVMKELIVSLWKQIEDMVGFLMSMDKAMPKEEQSVLSVINYLEGILTNSVDVKKILVVRNGIVQGGNIKSRRTIKEVIEMEKRIIETLEDLIKEKINKLAIVENKI